MPTTTHTLRRTVRNGDAELYVEQTGSGPDLLLLAGLGDTVEVWSNQVDGLSDRYRITTVDNRGIGRSPLPASGVTIEHMAADAAAVIEELGTGPANVGGFSGGGMIAQQLALSYPHLVRSLVLNGTYTRFDVRGQRMAASWMTIAQHAESPRAFYEQFLAYIYTRAAHEDGRVEAWIQAFLDFEHPASDEIIGLQLAAWGAADMSGRLNRIAVPTLVLHGEEDMACPVSHGREIAAGIPGARLEILPGQGHQPFQEIPDAWNALVDEFLRRVGA